eukprot:273485_1
MDTSSTFLNKRVMQEIKQLAKANTLIVNSKTVTCMDNNITIDLNGPKNTPFAGFSFKIQAKIGSKYPFEPPKLSFKTKMFLPGIVHMENGEICLQNICEWSPNISLCYILKKLYQAMQKCTVDPIAVKQWCVRYAIQYIPSSSVSSNNHNSNMSVCSTSSGYNCNSISDISMHSVMSVCSQTTKTDPMSISINSNYISVMSIDR